MGNIFSSELVEKKEEPLLCCVCKKKFTFKCLICSQCKAYFHITCYLDDGTNKRGICPICKKSNDIDIIHPNSISFEI